jgi:ABC-type transport system substrate-binding protein
LKSILPQRDVQEAKALLSASGHEKIDVSLKHINVGKHPALAEMIATQLKDAGINAKLEPMDIPTFISHVPLQFEFEMNSRYNIAFTSPEQPLRIFLTTGGQGKESEWGVGYPDVDAAFDSANLAFDVEERRQRVKEMQRLILSKYAPALYLYAPYLFTQIRGFVKGVQATTGQTAYFDYRVWLDK